MTENLPDTLASLGGQAALFDDPRLILKWDDTFLRTVAANIGREGGSVLAQVRRAVGLVAWAAWYRMSEKDYRSFAEGLAGDLDIEVETLRNWRRAVVRTDKLPVPGVAESAKGRKTAGQPTGALSPTAPSGVIPAASTEAPAKKSEGGGLVGETRPAPQIRPPSDPSPVGGNALGEVSAPPTAVPPEVDVDAIGLRWLKSKSVQQVRSIGDPWGPAIRSEIQRWMSAFGYVEAPNFAKPERLNGTAGRPTARITPTAARIGGKRHADDCSCLSCAPPKAAKG